MSSLEVQHATVMAGRRPILDDASLALKPGTVTAIIGPNGAGKSTLLNVATGALRPVQGTVLLHGTDIKALSFRESAQRRAVMPQDSAVAFPFTVREVVAMGRTAWNTSVEKNTEIVDDTLRLVELAELADREVTTLSGGERQRVALARVIAQATPIHAGSVLLFDEPTSAMDISFAETTMALMRTLAAHGAAIGVALHDLDAAASYADYTVLMTDGKVHRSGNVAEVCRADVLSDVYKTPIEVFTRGNRTHIAPQRNFAHSPFIAS